jgi:hypothetical protein
MIEAIVIILVVLAVLGLAAAPPIMKKWRSPAANWVSG